MPVGRKLHGLESDHAFAQILRVSLKKGTGFGHTWPLMALFSCPMPSIPHSPAGTPSSRIRARADPIKAGWQCVPPSAPPSRLLLCQCPGSISARGSIVPAGVEGCVQSHGEGSTLQLTSMMKTLRIHSRIPDPNPNPH